MNGAIYVSNSHNGKLAGSEPIDSTYVSIQNSCSSSCPLKKDNTCYAKSSFVGMIVNRLEKESVGKSSLQLARAEAKAINESYKDKLVPLNRPLRLHVSGDSRSIKGTKLINAAVGKWKERGGGACYSYSHSWRKVPKSLWSNVSMLASIDKIEDAALARTQGYAPALIVSEFKSDKTYQIDGSDIKFIPCPAQTRDDVSCVDCRLCFNSDRLFKDNFGILFSAHGIRKNVLKKRLNVIQ